MASYTYPNYPKQLNTDDGSYWIGNRYPTHPDGNLGHYQFGSVVDIDLSDFDPTIYNSQNNPYVKKLFTLKNGFSLNISLYHIYDPNVPTFGVASESFWLDEDGNRTTMLRIADTYAQANWMVGSNRTTFDPYHAKMVFLAVYPTNTIPEVSESNFFEIGWYFDKPTFTRNIGLDVVTIENDLSVVYEGNITQRQYIFSGVYEGERYPVYPSEVPIATIDFDKFTEYIKGHGDPFEGDVFNPDDPDKPPAGGDDTSGPGGGGGNYDPISDPVDFPALPIGGALTSGMIKGFLVGPSHLTQIQNKLWNMSIFDISTQFQKLVNQPLDCLISLHALPLIPDNGNSEPVKLGSFDTEILAPRITNQYKVVNGGTYKLNLFWGSALDYAPYTTCEIFLPFIGFRNVKIEDVMGQNLILQYHVDVLTGDCVAYLKCGISVLYSWTGNCLTHIPCTANSSDMLAKSIGAIGSIGVGMLTGNPTSSIITSAVNVAMSKNHVQRSGDVAGSPGIMSDYVPYLVIHRPKQSLARDYNKFKGYPSNITNLLGNLSGYTEVEHIHLTGIAGATDGELAEIETLLKEGVII